MPGSSPKHICFFLPSLAGGGAEKLIVDLANTFAGLDHRVSILCGQAEGPNLSRVSEDVEIIDLQRSHVFACIVPIWRYLNRENPSAIMANMSHANVAVLLASIFSFFFKGRVIVQEVAPIEKGRNEHNAFRETMVLFLMRVLYSRASSVIGISQSIHEEIERLIWLTVKDLRTIPGFVDIKLATSHQDEAVPCPWLMEKNCPVIIAVGRMSSEKGFDTLLKSIALVREDRPVRLVILGEGDLRGELEALTVDLGIADDVLMPGFVDNPAAWLSRSDVFVLSSTFEGFGIVVAEALSARCNIITTDCNQGPMDIIGGGEFGTIVPVNDPVGMADGIKTRLDHPLSEEVLSTRAREFDLSVVAQKYLDTILGRINAKEALPQSDTMLQFITGRSLRLLTVTSIGTFLAYVAQMTVARILDVETFGYYAYIMTMLGVLTFIAQFGFDYLFMRFVPIYKASGEVKKLSFCLVSGFATVFAFGAILSFVTGEFYVIAQFDQWPSIFFEGMWIGVFIVPLLVMLYVLQAVMTGCQKYVLGKMFTEIGRPLLYLLGIGAFIVLGVQPQLQDMLTLNLIVVAGLAVVGFFVLRKVLPELTLKGFRIETKLLKEWYGISFPLFLYAIPTMLILQIDTLFLGAILGPGAVGTYWAAAKVATLAAFPLYAVNTVVAPMIAKNHAQGESFLSVMRHSTFFSVIMCLGVCVVFLGFGETILGLFGPEYVAAMPIVYVLAAGYLLATLLGPVDYALVMTGYEKFSAFATGAGLLLCVALNYILIPEYQTMGAAFATAASLVMIRVILMLGVWRYHGILMFMPMLKKR